MSEAKSVGIVCTKHLRPVHQKLYTSTKPFETDSLTDTDTEMSKWDHADKNFLLLKQTFNVETTKGLLLIEGAVPLLVPTLIVTEPLG